MIGGPIHSQEEFDARVQNGPLARAEMLVGKIRGSTRDLFRALDARDFDGVERWFLAHKHLTERVSDALYEAEQARGAL